MLGGLSPEKWEGLAIGPRLRDGSYLVLAGADNDYSVTQNVSGLLFDIYFNTTTGARARCDLGSPTQCVAVQADGSATTTRPGVPHAYKDSAADLAGYRVPAKRPAR